MPRQICSECSVFFEARDYPTPKRFCSNRCRQRDFQRRREAQIIEQARRDLLREQRHGQ